MPNRRTVAWIGLGVGIAVTLVALPSILHSGALYWTKMKAHRMIQSYPSDAQKYLDTVPVRIEFPKPLIQPQDLATIEHDKFSIRVPPPVSHKFDQNMLVLSYPRFVVLITRAAVVAPAEIELLWASNHTRLGDIDAQRDLASLKRILTLIAMKPTATAFTEEFIREDMRGCIMDPVARGKTAIVHLFLPAAERGFGVWFSDSGGLTRHDIHLFLASLQFSGGPADVSNLNNSAKPAATNPQ